ncbi:MAG: hypothetical protein PVS2B2_09200 [Candidatus Acidiferrum sp.]
MKRILFLCVLVTALVQPASIALAQSGEQTSGAAQPEKKISRPGQLTKLKIYGNQLKPAETGESRFDASLAGKIARDQKKIWTSPLRIRVQHLDWLIPAAGVTAGLLVTDRDVSSHLNVSAENRKKYRNDSNYGVLGIAGVAGGMYVLGEIYGDAHKKEAGLLSGEAAVDAFAVASALKYGLGRNRPLQSPGNGRFFDGGNSFPSGHVAVAWSIASVLAHEYPGPLTKLLAYGTASAISVARVRAKEHFPSDVVVGAGVGWLIGEYVYRAHHQSELGGGAWGALEGLGAKGEHGTSAMGSPYVPLDSWIYAPFDQLIALGYIDSAIVGMRPWTRLECARLLAEAGNRSDEDFAEPQKARLLLELMREFEPEIELLGGGENRAAHLESVYSRFTQISGPPLADGEHFGETFFNDFGRPFQQGLNNVTGLSAWGTAGRWVVYVRGEYQHAPSWPGYSTAVQNEIAFLDQNPAAPAIPGEARNQARLLDGYVGLNLGNWQISYGQQSQWWGPGVSGAMLFSDNASPIRMFHIDRVSPFTLPGILKYLGPTRWEAFFGDLQGLPFSPGPVFHGEKISFKPTPNLEFGFTRTVVFAGQGRALTLDRLFRSYFSVTSSANETAATDPGKRGGGFDFQYRVPLLRKWLTIYTDSIVADDPSPLAAPMRAGISPGIYVPQLPKLPKLDLRIEAANTSIDQVHFTNGHFIYWDGHYHQVYTNRGNLMGSAVGLDGTEILAASRLWLGTRNSIQFGYRHAKVAGRYIPSGGTINDASARGDFWLRSVLGVTAIVQVERWNFPLLAPGVQQNISGSLQLTYWPVRHHRETP